MDTARKAKKIERNNRANEQLMAVIIIIKPGRSTYRTQQNGQTNRRWGITKNKRDSQEGCGHEGISTRNPREITHSQKKREERLVSLDDINNKPTNSWAKIKKKRISIISQSWLLYTTH